PLGIELPDGLLSAEERARLTAPTALDRARAVRDAAQRLRGAGTDLPDTGTAFRQLVHGHGYLLARSTGPAGTTAPTGFVVGASVHRTMPPRRSRACSPGRGSGCWRPTSRWCSGCAGSSSTTA